VDLVARKDGAAAGRWSSAETQELVLEQGGVADRKEARPHGEGRF
jgi:hypothetical protein